MEQSRPNIVLIPADDLRPGRVSCFNPEARWQTPQVDRLAVAGMRFAHSHATSSLCSPSRYGLLTGRYNWGKQSVLPGDSEGLIERNRLTCRTFSRSRVTARQSSAVSGRA